MKINLRQIENSIKEWIVILFKLFWEIVLFLINIPQYLYKFFSGLRIFAESYDGIIKGLETQQKFLNSLTQSRVNEQSLAQMLREYIRETTRLKKIQEEMFTGLFGILIAVLALFISVIALLINT